MPGICFILSHHNRSAKSSIFPVLPFSCCFYVLFFKDYAVPKDNPGLPSRLGDAEHKDLKVERSCCRKKREKWQCWGRMRKKPGTGTSSSAASRDASAWSGDSIPAAYSTLSTMASSSAVAPNLLPSHGSDMLGQTCSPSFCPGELPAHTLCAQKNWGLCSCGWHLLQRRTVASSSGKHMFIASPTAEHFGYEKYINVTTTFITIFIPHLMLSLCDLHTKYIFKGKHIHFYLQKKEDSK